MPSERLSMRRIRELLRLKFENGIMAELLDHERRDIRFVARVGVAILQPIVGWGRVLERH